MKKAFDYLGLTEKELLALCDDNNSFKGLAKWKYWTTESYSFGWNIRQYAFYPVFLPLYAYSNHGVGYYTDYITPHELNNDAPCQFYQSKDVVKLFQATSSKPCYVMKSPFVMYRQRHNITQVSQPKGTLAFFAHSTDAVDVQVEEETYIKKLRALPEEYHPICVCLHMHDIRKGKYKFLLESGFPVYTVGNGTDQRFAKRFYDLIRNFKYTTSNMLGSYAYYSVEIGIPFFIYGDMPVLMNHGDANIPKGEYKLKNNAFYQYAYNLFLTRSNEITKEQQTLIENHLGIKDGLSRWEMAKVLYWAYLKKGNLIKDIASLFIDGFAYIWKRIIKNRQKTYG